MTCRLGLKRSASCTTSAWIAALLLSLLVVTSVRGEDKPGFVIQSVAPQWQDNVYQVDARIGAVLNEHALEALNKGVPVVIVLDVEVERRRPWYLPEKSIAVLAQRYQLKYHALTERFLLTNLNTGVQSVYPTLAPMLEAVGVVTNFPVLDRQLLEAGAEYTVRLRARLDLDALPAMLRMLAYVTPGWRQSSDWHVWKLEQ